MCPGLQFDFNFLQLPSVKTPEISPKKSLKSKKLGVTKEDSLLLQELVILKRRARF